MRIAGNTLRRNYLSRYEKNYSDKYSSEKKIYSGRQFDRASENPINAARALRIRKSISEVETYQDNLKTADSIYTNAETAMRTVSTIIQSVYEKLVEGAHGTRNPDDLEILAKEVDNYAEEMVQSLNIDIADRKVFGGLNNDTVAFKIEGNGTDKYVTYNGVAINSSNDPETFPYSGTSYLDIGIGMTTDERIDRIDDQTALPITFNGAECTGCGMTRKTSALDLISLIPGSTYKLNVNVGGTKRDIEFTADVDKDKTIDAINAKLKEEFKSVPEFTNTGTVEILDDPKIYNYGSITATNNMIPTGGIEDGKYYSIIVKTDSKERQVDFLGNSATPIANLQKALEEQFGDGVRAISDGVNIKITMNNKQALITTSGTDDTIKQATIVSTAAGDQLDFSSLQAGETYAINLSGTKVNEKGETVAVEGKKIYFTAADDGSGNVDQAATVQAINDYIANNRLFGTAIYPSINETGTFMYDDPDQNIIVTTAIDSPNEAQLTSIDGYPKNIMQLVLDSAKLLRDNNQQMVARYADLLYAAQGSLSIAIADLGTNSKFIEFNEDRLNEVKINLDSKQNDIESTDLPSEITRWKVLESVYNASLQMGASVLSQSIFNYIS